MSKKLLSYLLKRFESFPEARFYESDLTRVSATEFAHLKKQRYLVYDQHDFEKEIYFDKHGNERFVRKVKGQWVATSTENPEISPIYLDDKDLNRYSFSVLPLLTEIKAQNALTKTIDRISSRIFFIGEKTVLHDNVGIFTAFLGDDEQAEAELLGFRAKIGKAEKILVLCPTYVITSQNLLNRLARQNITCLTFEEAFNGTECVIDFSKVQSEAAGQTGPKLTAKQVADYTKNGYLCYDSLHIPGTGQLKRSNDVVVNGHTIKMPDGPFRLFVELVAELKKGEGGWLTKFTETGKYQIYSDLRKRIEGSLIDRDAKKFIENDGSKRYRISTHPELVTYERGNLSNHTDPEVRELADKLP